jgi:hypothetical protein
MVSYQYALRELRAKHAFERELKKKEFERYEIARELSRKSGVQSESSKWMEFFSAIGFVCVTAFQFLGLLLKAFGRILMFMIEVGKTKPKVESTDRIVLRNRNGKRAYVVRESNEIPCTTKKHFKGLCGQIDDLEKSPFVAENAFRRSR